MEFQEKTLISQKNLNIRKRGTFEKNSGSRNYQKTVNNPEKTLIFEKSGTFEKIGPTSKIMIIMTVMIIIIIIIKRTIMIIIIIPLKSHAKSSKNYIKSYQSKF